MFFMHPHTLPLVYFVKRTFLDFFSFLLTLLPSEMKYKIMGGKRKGDYLPLPPAEGSARRSCAAELTDFHCSTCSHGHMLALQMHERPHRLLQAPVLPSRPAKLALLQRGCYTARLCDRLPAAWTPCVPDWFVLVPGCNSVRSRGAVC